MLGFDDATLEAVEEMGKMELLAVLAPLQWHLGNCSAPGDNANCMSNCFLARHVCDRACYTILQGITASSS